MFIYFTGFIFILPFKGKQSPNRKTTSGIKNKNGKRSFLRTSENEVTDDVYCK